MSLIPSTICEKRKGKIKVGNQTLPKKILEMLKKSYKSLSKRACTSNSQYTKRSFIKATIAIVTVIFLSGFLLAQVMSAIQITRTVSNVGTLTLSADIEVYQDASFTNKATTIDWGTLDPGATKSYSIYIRNEGKIALSLSMSTSNWSPPSASNYLTLTWNYNGQTINEGEAIQVTLTLTVSDSITGISNFNFDINLVGSG
jgi:hypothetical protein